MPTETVMERTIYMEFPNQRGIERRLRRCPAPVTCMDGKYFVDGSRLTGATERFVKRYIKDLDQKTEAKHGERFREMCERGDVWGYDPTDPQGPVF